MAKSDLGSGPYVAAALFCERVLVEKDEVISAIRVVDRFTHRVTGGGTPRDMPPTTVTLTLLVALRSGDARGRSEVRTEVELPSGLKQPFGMTISVNFDGDERGNNLIFPLQWEVDQEGLYWFTVFVDDRPLTRVPLRVNYERLETGVRLG